MQILITGGTGYIGSHIAVELLTAGYDVILADNFSNSTPDVAEKVAEITHSTSSLHECDVADYEQLRNPNLPKIYLPCSRLLHG